MKKIYPAIGKTLFIWFAPLLKIYYKKRPSKRTRIVVLDNAGRVLLIKGWLSRQQWTLPGGGIAKHEKPVMAARRELREETGLTVATDELQYLGDFFDHDAAAPHEVALFAVKKVKNIDFSNRHKWEIIDVKWWPVKKLPPDTMPLVAKSLRKLPEVE